MHEGSRLLKRSPVAGFLRRRPAIHHLYMAARTSLVVRERGRLIWREMGRRDRLSRYRLRSGVRIFVRQPKQEVSIVDEFFYRGAIDPPAPVTELIERIAPLSIMDVGAHYGLFLAYAVDNLPVGSFLAFEPDPGNCAVLRDFLRENGDRLTCRLIEGCASTVTGLAQFRATGGGHSRMLEDGERHASSAAPIIAVPAVDVIPLMRGADLVKLDIQGGEWAILGDERLSADGPPILFVEYHAELCPGPDPTAHVLGLLRAGGYEVQMRPRNDGMAGAAWAWRAGVTPHDGQRSGDHPASSGSAPTPT